MIKNEILRKLEVIDIAKDGYGVVRNGDNAVIFVKGTVPGDFVDIRIVKKKKNYYEGEVLTYLKLSEHRNKPFCDHFGVCGGCKLQNMKYESTLLYKKKHIIDCLKRISKISEFEIEDIIYYRNKMEYTFSNRGWLDKEDYINGKTVEGALGLHVSGFYSRVLNINKCFLQRDPSNKIRNFIREYALKNNIPFFDIKFQNGFLRNLTIKTTQTEIMLIFSFFENIKSIIEPMLETVIKQFPEINSLIYVINNKKNDIITDLPYVTFYGLPYITENLGNIKFRIGPHSFFQTNTNQTVKLYDLIKEYSKFKKTDIVYDLYCGVGTISNYIAGSVKKVIGIEFVSQAIDDAIVNSKINNINNTKFYCGDVNKVIDKEFLRNNPLPDVIIIDPPRIGVHPDVIEKIIEINPEKIIYVSCNPSTQARDISLLMGHYKLIKTRGVDMFPYTDHIENVVLMEKI